ncbi:coiled-coil domain-containing protein 97 [Haematobia irritans]|uniref:coiled-coil domain-containing protein 97 n=1 Tax=Haematobia irritans TaxID=7368 RepID=UPI003F4FCAEE
MTTDNGNDEDESKKQCSTSSPPQEIMDILEYLSLNSKVVFKSQQRGEEEMPQTEKIQYAKDIYQRNPQTFLMRFGKYLEGKHLDDFARLSIAESDEEMHSMINVFQDKIKTKQQDIKNRRYVALQKLIEEGEYFSETEMMKRSPHLYHELIGQYLSEEEKKMRDSYDVRNTTFSGILMHSLEQKEITEIMEKAEHKGEFDSEDSQENGVVETNKVEDEEVPVSYRQQWGNFDNEQQACSTSRIKKFEATKIPKKKTNPNLDHLITADERELLRQEFVSQMHQQFLSGQSDFDYSTVDDNTEFDDLKILNQDKEDKYFEESDEDEEIANKSQNMHHSDEESEDELDVFMNHLNKHHSLQK